MLKTENEGMGGLYRSYPITVAMNMPFAAGVICTNENLKTLIKPWECKYPYFWYFICAGTAGGPRADRRGQRGCQETMDGESQHFRRHRGH